MKRTPQRGAAMLVTMILITSLIAGALVLTQMQIGSTRSAGISNRARKSFNCAEAGLASARGFVAANINLWNTALAAYPSKVEPLWLQTMIGSHDLDNDGVDDFAVYLADNDDELTGPNDLTRNSDLEVYIVSMCVNDDETPQEVRELIEVSGGSYAYEAQAGGSTSASNRTQ